MTKFRARMVAACAAALMAAFAVPVTADAARFFRSRQPTYVMQPQGYVMPQQVQVPQQRVVTPQDHSGWTRANPGNTRSLSHPKWRADRKATGAAYLR